MRRARTAVAILLLAIPLAAQDRVAWLADRAIRLRTLDPSDDDFRDLEPLRKKLRRVRVVLLGEQSHGDGTTFVAKTRLIRFLHERMGFDVITFESGLYDCAKAWDRLREGEDAATAVPRGVFTIWSGTVEVQPLIRYIGEQAKGAHPLELAGVDCQLTGTASNDFLVRDLAAYLTRIDPKLAQGDDWNRVVLVINRLASSFWEEGTQPMPDAKEQEAFAATIEAWRSAIAARDRTPATRPWSGPFWRQFLASLRLFAEETWGTKWPDPADPPDVFAMRDRQMGENLAWLAAKRYPKRKIIVWAATFHNARNIRTIETGSARSAAFYKATAPMGEVARRSLGRRLYSLGVTSFEGESNMVTGVKAGPLPVPSAGSLEDLCARAGLDNAIIDFRRAPRWLRAPMAAQLTSHTEMRADWTKVVDGVLFLRKMERSHRAAKARRN